MLVGRPSESHPLHNSGLLSLDPVQDKTPLYSQLLQAYKWSNKITLGKVLKVIVVMRSLFIDRTIVRGFHENVYTDDRKTWLRSYMKLFHTPCQRCGKHLQEGLPPTWRDFNTLEAFHDTCRE